jgi:hypothetical protein
MDSGEVAAHASRFGAPLIDLLESDWHDLQDHTVKALGQVRSEEAVPLTLRAAERIPAYLVYSTGGAAGRRCAACPPKRGRTSAS